ncbi:Uncharacterized conserved protein, DUF2336 family [Devosia enhydra]|uniref:Uncharacterized conserved protein, DUF2336 family n=1 Tax=Devosia enhydra TaxID=665118 RepID=A0A1K2HSX0_9HYPH|nr:DUF2336 domain-containing protein [Devosia enhydra]SFZ81020.1 Uncharacterized conserved protein, DUF2336 family [Devosia enhydra]
MVAYADFVALSGSSGSDARGQAAHLAAQAYSFHSGPADEQAALYAALIGFLDDPSVRVRAALAYGLLHAPAAPRPILLALLHDSPIISRAIAQYSPAVLDADLLPLVPDADLAMLLAIAERPAIGPRLAEALIRRDQRPVLARLLARREVRLSAQVFEDIVEKHADDAGLRGHLLDRNDLPASLRLILIDRSVAAIARTRIVCGAIAPRRLERLLGQLRDAALTSLGEAEAGAGRAPYAVEAIEQNRVSTRVMLHAVIHGRVLFFADCLAALAESPRTKVFSILESGSRPVLLALLRRAGLSPNVANLLARLVFLARTADLADDVAARHYVVTALTEELIVDHAGDIPAELDAAFTYLSEQNVVLARAAARGVLASFAAEDGAHVLPVLPAEPRMALPAA